MREILALIRCEFLPFGQAFLKGGGEGGGGGGLGAEEPGVYSPFF